MPSFGFSGLSLLCSLFSTFFALVVGRPSAGAGSCFTFCHQSLLSRGPGSNYRRAPFNPPSRTQCQFQQKGHAPFWRTGGCGNPP
ncbi:hypothetical protein BDQ94DRAFT_150899 [Aspergillus welwitschiae]|uniref:Secreted protein n=1 Tax=Aspergillus welwitschiae TaxID=1341132 RepID=A0A3F3PQR3_9EURO|nr:hypothetical protein BDQ94DRAFT_150899 [Aspergillus welwitschiae]RDH29289.1 hypothetical protein BDQ94DRAFT_150899 [Aspergillus welwitschiae]